MASITCSSLCWLKILVWFVWTLGLPGNHGNTSSANIVKSNGTAPSRRQGWSLRLGSTTACSPLPVDSKDHIHAARPVRKVEHDEIGPRVLGLDFSPRGEERPRGSHLGEARQALATVLIGLALVVACVTLRDGSQEVVRGGAQDPLVPNEEVFTPGQALGVNVIQHLPLELVKVVLVVPPRPVHPVRVVDVVGPAMQVVVVAVNDDT